MIDIIKSIVNGISAIMGDVLSGIANGMIYENIVISNGGGMIIREALK